MKFGKQLEHQELPRFRGYYVQYKELKKAIKVFTGQERTQATVEEVTHWTSNFLRLGPNPDVPPEARLQEILVKELDRISKFTELEEEALRRQLVRLEEDCQRGCDEASWTKLEELGESIVQLNKFSQLNFSGFRKILKKYDKWNKSNMSPWFMPTVARAPMMSVKYDDLLMKLSRAASVLRQDKQESEIPKGQQAAVGGEMKMFVAHKDAVRLKVELAKAMQWSGTSSTSLASPTSRVRTHVTYFDSPDLSVYRAYSATAWAGADDTEMPPSAGASGEVPCASIHLKRTDSDSMVLAYDAPGQLRGEVPLTHAQASRLFSGESPTVKGAHESTLRAAEQFLRNGAVVARAQASYVRHVHCEKGADGQTVFFDEDVRLAKISKWDEVAASTESFPYDVLTVTASAHARMQQDEGWLSRVFKSCDIFPVPSLSFAAHSIARYHNRNRSLPMPHWYRSVEEAYDDDAESQHPKSESPTSASPAPASPRVQRDRVGSDTMSQITQGPASRFVHEFGPTAEQNFKDELERAASAATVANDLSASLLGPGTTLSTEPTPALAPALAPAGGGGWLRRILGRGSGSKPVRRAIVAVQPKTLYSNERTFLEWVHFATIFSAIGIVMLHGIGGSSAEMVLIGRFIIGSSIFVVVWALHTFNWRAAALDKKSGNDYQDHVGPPALVGSLMVALTCSALHAGGFLQLDSSR